MTTGLLTLAIFTLTFTMLAKRLSSTVVTAPMIFIALGYFFYEADLLPQDGAEAALHIVAEIALIILLFLDAAQIDLGALKKSSVWPARMLLIGLPLAIGFGTITAWFFLPGWPWVALALVFPRRSTFRCPRSRLSKPKSFPLREHEHLARSQHGPRATSIRKRLAGRSHQFADSK